MARRRDWSPAGWAKYERHRWRRGATSCSCGSAAGCARARDLPRRGLARPLTFRARTRRASSGWRERRAGSPPRLGSLRPAGSRRRSATEPQLGPAGCRRRPAARDTVATVLPGYGSRRGASPRGVRHRALRPATYRLMASPAMRVATARRRSGSGSGSCGAEIRLVARPGVVRRERRSTTWAIRIKRAPRPSDHVRTRSVTGSAACMSRLAGSARSSSGSPPRTWLRRCRDGARRGRRASAASRSRSGPTPAASSVVVDARDERRRSRTRRTRSGRGARCRSARGARPGRGTSPTTSSKFEKSLRSGM